MAIFDTLRRQKDFTSTEEALADFVLAHPDDVAEMSIASLSKATHTSNAAVVRFCQRLGLDGYRSFRIELTRELEHMRSHALDVNPDQPFLEGSHTRDVMSSIASLSRQAIDATYGTLSVHEVQRAARLIMKARRVAIYANGDSSISGDAFANLILKLGIVAYNAGEHSDELSVSHAMGTSDVALFLTYSGGAFEDMHQAYDVLQSQGCKIIAVTADDTLAERLPALDCLLLLPMGENRSTRVATYYSQACIRYALNCVYGEIFSRNWRDSMQKRDRYASTDTYAEQ